MQFTIITALFAAAALAAPAPASSSSSRKSVGSNTKGTTKQANTIWTIKDLKRTCDSDDTECDWSFTILEDDGDSTDCAYTIEGSSSVPASKTSNKGTKCGPYLVSHNYDDFTFPDDPWTAGSIVKTKDGLIIYPGYTDVELGVDGEVVEPDHEYPVEGVPAV